MSNKDPFGMRRPAQQFKTMVETQRERADKAERQRDQLAEALRGCLDDLEAWRESFPSFADNEDVDTKVRAALAATEENK